MKKIIENIKKDWLILLLMIITLIVSIYLYPSLPDKMPSHWNIKGEVDAYSSKLSGVLNINLMNIGFYFLFLILPSIDPKKQNYANFRPAYNVIRYTFHLLFVALQYIVLLSSLGYKFNVGTIVTLWVGIMFILLGNQMGRIKHNYFVGIRTPWTLADETVWVKTHRFSAPLWVVGGFIVGILSFFSGTVAFIGLMIVIFTISIIPIIYSYLCFKNMKK